MSRNKMLNLKLNIYIFISHIFCNIVSYLIGHNQQINTVIRNTKTTPVHESEKRAFVETTAEKH